MSEDSTYNGWTNYETWAVGMFLDGNYTGEGTYREVLELVRDTAETADAKPGIWTVEQARLYEVEDALKDWAREIIEDGIDGIAGDLLGGALDEVNWRELAESKLAEITENAR